MWFSFSRNTFKIYISCDKWNTRDAFFSFYSGTIHVPHNIFSGITHSVRPLVKPQMLHTNSYIAVLINCWAKAIRKSLLFCRVVHASCDDTSCKLFYFYKLVLLDRQNMCMSRHNKTSLSVLCNFPDTDEEQAI